MNEGRYNLRNSRGVSHSNPIPTGVRCGLFDGVGGGS